MFILRRRSSASILLYMARAKFDLKYGPPRASLILTAAANTHTTTCHSSPALIQDTHSTYSTTSVRYHRVSRNVTQYKIQCYSYVKSTKCLEHCHGSRCVGRQLLSNGLVQPGLHTLPMV